MARNPPEISPVPKDAKVHRIVVDLRQPNGIAISPDQKTMYVITMGTTSTDILQDLGDMRAFQSGIHAYDLREDGTATFRQTLVSFSGPRWGDGRTVDADGNLYVAVAVAGSAADCGVHVYRPSGQLMEIISTPNNAVNVEFGRGAESNVLYVAAEQKLYRIRLKTSRFRLPWE